MKGFLSFPVLDGLGACSYVQIVLESGLAGMYRTLMALSSRILKTAMGYL
jgi:hypothetical protein